MNLKEIKEMIALMNENGLMELEVEKDGMRIKLKRSSGELSGAAHPVMIERETALPLTKAGLSGELIQGEAEKTIEIKAPMVGTFYRTPSPEAPPYADVGQVIEPGQVICIIEAMKLMNEINAEIEGEVVKVYVENGQAVQYGERLFAIRGHRS